jgi:hypothetical protein
MGFIDSAQAFDGFDRSVIAKSLEVLLNRYR